MDISFCFNKPKTIKLVYDSSDAELLTVFRMGQNMECDVLCIHWLKLRLIRWYMYLWICIPNFKTWGTSLRFQAFTWWNQSGYHIYPNKRCPRISGTFGTKKLISAAPEWALRSRCSAYSKNSVQLKKLYKATVFLRKENYTIFLMLTFHSK